MVGAVPRGTFNDYMPRHRFEHIMASLHFTNNADVQAASYRAWKVRYVMNTLQETFPRGYATPPVISFDEGIIPSRNRNNPTRQYLKGKPHKWGTKLFLTCWADTAYCMRYVKDVGPCEPTSFFCFIKHVVSNARLHFVWMYYTTSRLEVYCGKDQHVEELGYVPESQRSADPNSGPSAVIRNLEAVLPATQDGVYHLVVTDRFYTLVQLALQLLHRNVYSIGTIMGDKVGYPQEIVEKNHNRPKSVQHGTVRMAVARNCAAMTGLVWWDRKPVQVLGTGSRRKWRRAVMRRIRGNGGRRHAIPCPSMVRDYHRWMGGVDIHDQLRLHRYSLQLQTWCKKY
ncbi:hypothetical protein PHPALM_30376 [Phytophthora palmivora]|uniref:PiggyBac transposable element-derived protein domain-containing protein n=1 Tax=Phytophthora palmivora TaxID=4796 RepID=A0A2P4X598_9STRA|nr:hypothetical protein PHPALM_30376 [Phytophthora palmivora]